MAVVVNTNVSSLIVQKSLNAATSSMDTAMERMSTGLRINSAKDDAAGMAVSAGLEKTIGASQIAQSNAQMGSNMLTVTEGNLDVIRSNLLRIRDLYEQAANDTYGTSARGAILEEVKSRFQEIDRLAQAADFNGIKLLDGVGVTADVRLQVGTDSLSSSKILVSSSIFAATGISSMSLGLTNCTSTGIGSASLSNLKLHTAEQAASVLGNLDTAIDGIVTRQTKIGAVQNRLTSSVEASEVQEINLTSSNSQIKDVDVAEASSDYVKYQILQQSAATLLSQANQTPSIALSLV